VEEFQGVTSKAPEGPAQRGRDGYFAKRPVSSVDQASAGRRQTLDTIVSALGQKPEKPMPAIDFKADH